jgi:excisionase family DNA binding protein
MSEMETLSELTDLPKSERISASPPIPRVGRAGRPLRVPPNATDGRPAWLTIHEASALIGVSEATLRRWAEAGDVEAFVTPGGHRRFTRGAILGLLPHPGRPHRTLEQLGGTPERVVRQYRRDLTSGHGHWLPDLGEAELEAFREPGRRMLAGVLGYLDAPTDEARAEALAIATDAASTYGRLARARGLSLTATVEAFLHFRSPFLEELATIVRRRRLEASEAISLVIATAGVFDRLLVTLLDSHLTPIGEA